VDSALWSYAQINNCLFLHKVGRVEIYIIVKKSKKVGKYFILSTVLTKLKL